MNWSIILVAFLLLGTSANAADLSVSLRAANEPVVDAVVTVYPASGTPAGPIKFDWPLRMAQKNIQFTPFVLIVPVGATVAFPNLDSVRHHVYSFSPARRFELKLYGRDELETVKFDKAGAVALGCNIHDPMIAFIKVVDTPYAAKSDAAGHVVVHGLPPGKAVVRIWHPFLKAAGNEIARNVIIGAQGVTRDAATLDLRPPPKAMKH